jgi:hypothetical protein
MVCGNETPADQQARTPLRKRLPEAAGVLWVLAAAAVVMAPALLHGVALGPESILAQSGLSKASGVPVTRPLAADQIGQLIPWATLAWQQVHQGHLPLWNPYSAFGAPLVFNWQSAAFSLPSLIGYLLPLRLAYTAQVLLTLAIAGTGAYTLGRILKLTVVASAFVGTAFELSGPFFSWLGWPHAAVAAWGGWIFAAAILVIRGNKRPWSVIALALVVACAIYAGQPEILVLTMLCLGVFVAVLLLFRLRAGASVRRAILDLAAGLVAGFALGAPLLLPGLQLASGSIRNIQGNYSFSLKVVVQLLVPGFGIPLDNSSEYLGVIALVLIGVGIATGYRKPEICACLDALSFAAVLALVSPVGGLLNGIPSIGHLLWYRAQLPMALFASVIAGVGLDVLIRSKKHKYAYWVGAGLIAALVALFGVWVFGRRHILPYLYDGALNFIWPTVEAVVGVALIALLVWVTRGGRTPEHRWFEPYRLVGFLLLAGESAFLIAIGIPFWSANSSPAPLTPTHPEVVFKRAVGAALVGYGPGPTLPWLGTLGGCFTAGNLGVPGNVNVAFAVRQFEDYDPLLPAKYFSAWAEVSPSRAGLEYLYCPAITTVAQARLYGIGFVLESHGVPGPIGSAFVEAIDGEDLYRIPYTASATLTPVVGHTLPSKGSYGSPLSVSHPSPSQWKMTTDAHREEVLRVRLTDVPGWHASIDGRPLSLAPFAGIMLQARIPPGRHVIVLRYWPNSFTEGLIIAACAIVFLIGFGWITLRRDPPIRPSDKSPRCCTG